MVGFLFSAQQFLTQPMDPEKKKMNFIFPTKYVIPKSLAIGQVRFSFNIAVFHSGQSQNCVFFFGRKES